jgi:hypothetical protein
MQSNFINTNKRFANEMKRIRIALFLIVALCNYLAANSQEKIIIRGRVIDKADKSTIIGANVVGKIECNRLQNKRN